VGNCCSPKGYCWIFSERRARAEAKRYRRKGLDVTSRRIVDFLKQQGVHGRTLIEVGGGVGGIQIDLLKAGVASAISIELTPTYEEAAWALLREAGLADRVERKVMDFAEAAAEVKAADIVIMNRVRLLLSGHAEADRGGQRPCEGAPGDYLPQGPMVDTDRIEAR